MKNRITSLEIVDLKIPFKLNFKHHSAERNLTQAVIVIAGNEELKGYGESCPREYVTNESIETVLDFFLKVKPALLLQVSDLESLQNFVNSNKNQIAENPSAWCSIELALLDLFAKQEQCSLEKLLSQPELAGSFYYTAVIGDDSLETFNKTASQYVKMGFTDFKIKISGNPALDYEKLLLLKQLANDNCTVRLDANNIWNNTEDAISYIKNIPISISAIEEPLMAKNITQLKQLADQIDVPLILDESFNSIDQLNELLSHKSAFIINLRVSKMGGLLQSLVIADRAVKEGIGLIIGAQVGETSILTRAALCVANSVKPYYKAMEGAFGTNLLEHDIVENPLMFGKEGELIPEQLLNKGVNGFQLKVLEPTFTAASFS